MPLLYDTFTTRVLGIDFHVSASSLAVAYQDNHYLRCGYESRGASSILPIFSAPHFPSPFPTVIIYAGIEGRDGHGLWSL